MISYLNRDLIFRHPPETGSVCLAGKLKINRSQFLSSIKLWTAWRWSRPMKTAKTVSVMHVSKLVSDWIVWKWSRPMRTAKTVSVMHVSKPVSDWIVWRWSRPMRTAKTASVMHVSKLVSDWMDGTFELKQCSCDTRQWLDSSKIIPPNEDSHGPFCIAHKVLVLNPVYPPLLFPTPPSLSR